MDELEGIVEPLPRTAEDDEQDRAWAAIEEEQRSAKRQKMIEPVKTTPNLSSIISSNAMEGLKRVAEMRQKQNGGASRAAPKPAAAGISGLADYGSDSD